MKKRIEIKNRLKPDEIDALKAEYRDKGLDQTPDTFVLYRILGNDLYPRHKIGQTLENLSFVLENEPELEYCEKRWIVNRVIDKKAEYKIIELLSRYKKSFIHLPFRETVYKSISWDTECLPGDSYISIQHALGPSQRERLLAATYRFKNNYAFNNNGARNTALRDGKTRAKWVLPWDGNCFITSAAWKQIRADIAASPYLKYFAVPMTRVIDNKLLLSDQFNSNPVEEPQLIFRKDSLEEFNEEFRYGHRSKVELFWRLAIPGKWDSWKDDPWDLPRRPISREAHQFGNAGWTVRLFSGMEALEQDSEESFQQRGDARRHAIITTLQHLDGMFSEKSVNSNTLSIFRNKVLREEKNRYQSGELLPPLAYLKLDAEDALARGPYSVIDKKSLPPSGNPNDYWHPAPYWWPNPDTPNGLPYIRRDGERVPGTRMFEPDSDNYDRTRLQRVFDDSIILALAWYFTGEMKYAEHGAGILERFFIHPATRMTPHLQYAQVVMGSTKIRGYGIIEMKDLYYYLDAVRLLQSSGIISEHTISLFKDWLSEYMDWLLRSPQGREECRAPNNHGTYYDLQVAAIADFLDDRPRLFEALIRAQSRIALHFAPDGSQPEELKRTITAHYCCFNLQGWVNLTELASQWGTDLWAYESSNGASLVKAAQWLLSHIDKPWPYQQIEPFDARRFLPIWFSIPNSRKWVDSAIFPKSKYTVSPKFFPHDGIRPYWNLGLGSSI